MRAVWRSGPAGCGRTKVMGILNVTPDSFSDGGRHPVREAAGHAMEMVDEGADIIDVGGESTRPGHTGVTTEEEIRRIVPVIKELSETSSVTISADTFKPAVAVAAIDAGAHIINDAGGSSEEMMAAVKELGAAMSIMHMSADVRIVHDTVMEGDVIARIILFLNSKAEAAMDIGIPADSIIIDPGIGFGKTMEQNRSVLMGTDRFCGRFPVLIGASRKRFLSHAFPHMDREDASVEAAVIAASKGASIVRVHDVKKTADALRQMK